MSLRAEVESMSLVLPLPRGRRVTMQVPIPLSEADWDQLMAMLEASRPGIVYEVDALPVTEPEEASDA